MTSRRQQLQDQYDHILPFCQEAADEYYGGNLDRGFRHWAFATIFAAGHDIQGNDIVEYTAIDGSDDFEIDGYYIPESDDECVIHLFQSKRRQPGTTMGPGELAKFLNSPNRILNPNEVAASNNQHTKDLHDQLTDILKQVNRGPCSINLVWATSGRLSQAARRHAEENTSRVVTGQVEGNPIELRVTLECWDLSDLYQQNLDQKDSDAPVTNCDFDFRLEPGTYHQTGLNAEYKTLSMTVPVKNIIDLFARHSFKIFRLNPRGPLGNKVNNSIKRTLLNDNRTRFHLLNNGITAICDYYTLDDGLLHVSDFQIINGCQTTMSLWNVRAVIQNDPSVLVNVKLTECPSHFAPTIAGTTNTQSALRAEDFISNEPLQIKLQREFAELTPPWFYQVKRGEWSKMISGPGDKERYRDPEGGFRQFSSKEVGQAVLAFAGFPGEAKDKIRTFLDKVPLPSVAREGDISYGRIYNDALTANQLLLPAMVQRKVWRQVAQDKDSNQWLEYARFHLVWLIGDILREHYKLEGNLFPANRAAAVAANINEWFKSIYEIAVVTIANTLQSSEGGSQYREFFRSAVNYRMIESNLQGALRLASNFGNPTANLPT